MGRIRERVAGYQCGSEWPSVISDISRYEPRGAAGTATASLMRFSSPAILSISRALQHDVLEQFRPFVRFVERADRVGLQDLHVPERGRRAGVRGHVIHFHQVLLPFA